MTLMTIGDYFEPEGSYFPSHLYRSPMPYGEHNALWTASGEP